MTLDPRQLESDDLQAKTRSLRALARSLVGDEHVAEDLVQDTWVTALGGKARRRGVLGAWLAGVTKNHARQQRRETKRRERRERAAARPEAMPADESLDRLDTLRHILDQVRELDEPYRSTLLLRYFEELSPQEIAERQGVPCATVRTRLHRALAKLRQCMDERSGGSRDAWVAPLIPFVAVGSTLAHASAATAATAATGAMGLELPASQAMTIGTSLKLKLGLGAGLLCLGSGIWLALPLLDSSRTEGGVVVHGEDRSRSPGAEGTRPHQMARQVQRSEEPNPQEAGQRIAVTIEAEDRHPPITPGMRVRIEGRILSAETGHGIGGASLECGRGEKIRADETGRFAQDVPISLEETRGQKRDAKLGKTVGTQSTQGPLIWLQASAPGFVSRWWKSKVPPDGGALRIDLELETAVVIQGIVVDPQGKAIESALVRTFRKGEKEVRTDRAGRFLIDDLDPARRKCWLYTSAKGYTGKGIELADLRAESSKEIRITLEFGSRIHGVVETRTHKPIEGATIELWSKDEVRAVSDSSGSWALDSVGTGIQRLIVRHEDFAILIREVTIAAQGQDLLVHLQLDQGRVLRGRLHDPAGRGIAKAELIMFHKRQRIDLVKSGPQGRFEKGRVPSSPINLYVKAEGFLPLWKTGVVVGDQPLDLELHRGAGLAGRVFDAHTGQPIERFQVRLLGSATATPKMGSGGKDLGKWIGTVIKVEDPQGEWRTGTKTLLPEGMATVLSIHAKGYAPARIEQALARVNPDPEDLPIGLVRGTSIRGRVVVATSGLPVARARIRILREAHSPAIPAKGQKQERRWTRSDRDGRFVLEHVSAGERRLLVEHPDGGVSVHRIRVPRATRVHQVLLRLTQQARLEGLAFDLDGRPLSGKQLTLQPANDPWLSARTWTGKTDSRGFFTFSGLPPGIYRLMRVEGSGKARLRLYGRHVQVGAEGTQRYELRVGGASDLRGTLRSALPLPARVIVTLTPQYAKTTAWEERQTERQVVASMGSFVFSSLPTGKWRLSVRSYEPTQGVMLVAQQEVEIGKSGLQRVDVRLQSTPARK